MCNAKGALSARGGVHKKWVLGFVTGKLRREGAIQGPNSLARSRVLCLPSRPHLCHRCNRGR